MNPEWRTDTVVQLCVAMRESQDFSALPILADALQDAYCDNESILDWLRLDREDYAWRVRLLALVYSQESNEAVATMEELARRVHYPFENMILAGKQYLETGTMFRDPEGENWDAENLFADYFSDPDDPANASLRDEIIESNKARDAYWNAFFLITGMKRPEDFSRNNPFICPC